MSLISALLDPIALGATQKAEAALDGNQRMLLGVCSTHRQIGLVRITFCWRPLAGALEISASAPLTCKLRLPEGMSQASLLVIQWQQSTLLLGLKASCGTLLLGSHHSLEGVCLGPSSHVCSSTLQITAGPSCRQFASASDKGDMPRQPGRQLCHAALDMMPCVHLCAIRHRVSPPRALQAGPLSLWFRQAVCICTAGSDGGSGGCGGIKRQVAVHSGWVGACLGHAPRGTWPP
jgi:hypothetical protein